MMKISVIGGGSWGTALANHLAIKGYAPVKVLVINEKYLKEINEKHTNENYLPGVKLNKNVIATMNYEEIIEADLIILSVPSHEMRNVIKTLKKYLGEKKPILVSTTKGIEEGTHMRMSQVIISELGEEWVERLAVLSGPTHAEEVSRQLPSSCVVAAKKKELAELVQDIFMSPTLRVYINPDIIGVELGGALKNIIALAAGIADGLGYGDNTKAALITRGLTEIARLGVAMGAKMMTFAGLSGLGDLVVTCASMHSRNRRFGILIGQGKTLEEATKEVKQVAEGVRTCRAVYEMTRDMDLELPIITQCYKVLFEGKDPEIGVSELMTRGAKHEIEEVARDDFEW
ncbi:glycerol-3-phosphate dehydrogenase [Anoxybacter fermentans]|uniref:Glycerol-3-phosphate dehydrogenase [NAD(P)+] n=1 Tax=Anoxybacter fermentans TaxID=1323375 RepID=A0A3Q9HPH5_9FIRM|nr:NAD(P)H-dependent glycerol-3-phosphate dehydrogenase [Anoxybacter fermentans]AZR72764.1 glycerol-3-phosphate dehydrogenase [Anoxybacter fermentans]